MDKRTKVIFMIMSALVIVAIFIINLIIRYEKQPLTSIPQGEIRESTSLKDLPLQKPEEPKSQEIEEEPPVATNEPLIN